MSVGILNPTGALALLAVGVLVVLHLFDRRRRVVPVATLFLWRQIPAHALERRRFRPDLLFLAQLALLLALVGGYLRPFLEQAAPTGDRVRLLVVLDTSASMQAREPGGTRFELARRRARTLVAQLIGGDEVMLVAAAERAHVLLRWTTDHGAAQGRLEALEPLDTPTNLVPALELALGEVAARPETQVVVLTDLPREASGVEAGRAARLDWVQIGRTDDNVAVAGLTVEDGPFQAVRDATATVLLRNYGHAERRVTVDATVGDVPWARREITLAPGGAEHVLLTGPPGSGPLRVTLDADDALPVDDRAVAWIPEATPLDVIVVSESPALAGTLAEVAASVAGARVRTVAPARWAEGETDDARVVIFDRVVPPTRSGVTPALYVEPPPGNAICPTDRVLDEAAVIDWDPDHAAIRGLDALEAITLTHATHLTAPGWGSVLALAATGGSAFPFLVAGELDHRRIACLGAAPFASADDVPLLTLLLATLRWLEDPPDRHALAAKTGVPVPLDGPADDDQDEGVRVAGDPPVLVAVRAGLHRLGTRVVTANLFDDRESDIGRTGGGESPATTRPPPAAVERLGRHEIGRWLYLAALMLLGLEWLLWRRRTFTGAAP
jgi:VWA domain-containing protein/aerotolerance regulator-like protein